MQFWKNGEFILRNKCLAPLPLSNTVLGLTQGLTDVTVPAQFQLFYDFMFTFEF